ncbi:hypothetical protein [Halodesulfovibrio aestuarii]|uniref:BRCT domain-containing protein n=1 Tax=Halodesulfovibrio aestuarii TaxID=126333 RepID=A0ABV4JUC2_9BACT
MASNPKNARIDCSNHAKLTTREYIIEKLTSELQGICSCVIDDRIVAPAEATLILQWLEKNYALIHNPFVDELLNTLQLALADNVIDEHELDSLLKLLDKITETGLSERISEVAGTIEYDSVPDSLSSSDLSGVQMCITGTLLCNERKEVLKFLKEQNVDAVTDVTQKTRYLVIGALGNKHWPDANMSKLDRVLKERILPESPLHGCKIISENTLLALFPNMPFQFERVVTVERNQNEKKSIAEVPLTLFEFERVS